MFDESFELSLVKFDGDKIGDLILQEDCRIIGDSGIEIFKERIFNFICDGYIVVVNKKVWS